MQTATGRDSERLPGKESHTVQSKRQRKRPVNPEGGAEARGGGGPGERGTRRGQSPRIDLYLLT